MRIALGVFGLLAGLAWLLVLWAGSAEQPEAWDPPDAPAPLSHVAGRLELSVTPSRGAIDEPLRISVRGASPGEAIVLRAATVDGAGVRFESWARLTADEAGSIDTATRSPLEGTYRSTDAGGLFWSMRAAGAVAYRFPDTASTEYRVSAETANGIVYSTVTRVNPALELASEAVQTDSMDARVWIPRDADAPLPAVIRLHGSEGKLDPIKSALLARAGFAVLDLRYADGSRLPQIVQVPVERVTAGVDWLASDPRIDASRIGILGGSKGAELALVAAAHDSRVRAVAAWSPASVAFEGIRLGALAPGSSWSWRGEPIPYAPFAWNWTGLLRHVVRLLFGKVSLLPIYEEALEGAPEDAAIPVERSEAAILLLAGRDDRMWPAARMSGELSDRLTARGHTRHETALFDAAGHRMRYALWPDRHEPSRFVGGGTPEGNHRAGQAAWSRIKDFFSRELGSPGPAPELLQPGSPPP